MIKLFEDEKIVLQSEHSLVELTLTTHRICYEYSVWGNSYNQYIALEHVTSCENKYASQIVYAILSIGFLIFGFSIDTKVSIVIGFTLFFVFAIVYMITKQNNIIIGSPSTKMKIDVKGMNNEKILDFINEIEETKYKRIVNINNHKKP